MITYNTNSYGLREKDMQYIQRLFAEIPEIEKVIIYGSRATGNFEKGSDVDLAIVGKKVTHQNIAHLHFMFENESPALLWFDVLHYDTLDNKKLKEQIDRQGKIIYERGANIGIAVEPVVRYRKS
ncbi:MAG: nucleotidyltransferase domain-containing protein [Bacteroidetes bacterium]|nr:nucleotidyltransferase domain-containing protein [Bacteroidota bacterium]